VGLNHKTPLTALINLSSGKNEALKMIAQLQRLLILTAAVFCIGVAVLILDTLSEFVTVYRAAINHVLFVAFKCVLFALFALALVLISNLKNTPLPCQSNENDREGGFFDDYSAEQGGAGDDLERLFNHKYND